MITKYLIKGSMTNSEIDKWKWHKKCNRLDKIEAWLLENYLDLMKKKNILKAKCNFFHMMEENYRMNLLEEYLKKLEFMNHLFRNKEIRGKLNQKLLRWKSTINKLKMKSKKKYLK